MQLQHQMPFAKWPFRRAVALLGEEAMLVLPPPRQDSGRGDWGHGQHTMVDIIIVGSVALSSAK